MKGNKSNCLNCGHYYIKKRDNHKFCKTSCRVKHNRKTRGIPEPSFLKSKNKKPLPYRSINRSSEQSQTIVQQGFTTTPNTETLYRTPANEIILLEQKRQYWVNVLVDADRGIFPLWMYAGIGTGALIGKTGLQKLGIGAIGYLIGKGLDEARRKNLIVQAQNNIAAIDKEIKALRSSEKTLKEFLKQLPKEQIKEVDRGNGIVDILSVEQYKKARIPSLGINKNKKWHYLFGDPSKNFMMLLHGLPGNGKSTFSVNFADYFEDNHGKVLYMASEQSGMNKSFQDLLSKYAKTDFTIHTAPKKISKRKLMKLCNEYQLIIFDSINHMEIDVEEFEAMRIKCDNTAFIAIMQSTKDGSFKGDQKWAHNSDIIIEMKNMIAHQTKSRFAPKAHIQVI